ncbi:MAG: 4Fe-4S binding protein [Candidatus Aminicenantes bacterium]|nr:MAG: 4Fe-4S binding protein [Candidatus Aminicenantes bacterium]
MEKKKITKERLANLRALAHKMNKQNVSSIPVTRALLDCFDVVITPEENEFLLKIGRDPLNFRQISAFSELPEESFRPFLKTLCEKGLIWTHYTEEEEELFVLPPILLGWFEAFLSDGADTPQKREFAHRVDDLFKSWGKFNVFPFRNLWNYHTQKKSRSHRRVVIPQETKEKVEIVQVDVRQKIKTPETKIYPTRSVFELIDKYGDKNQIAVVHCFCRQWRKFMGEPCRFEHADESCIALGRITRYTVNYGIARYISKEEALDIIKDVQKKGAIHQVFHEREDLDEPEIGICNCCWDCCGVIGSYSRGLIPMRARCYYVAQIPDESLCTGCGTCIKYCPVKAVSVVNKKSRIDEAKCIGCGQCELKCPEGIIALTFEEREVSLTLEKKSKARIKT